MRRPTDMDEAYAWHRAAMRGERPPVHEDQPQCGWYRRRLVKGGPWVACRIWIVQVLDEHGDLAEDERMVCEIDGEGDDLLDQWGWLASNPIPEERFTQMVAYRERCRTEDPMNAVLFPRRPIDLAAHPVTPGGSYA